MNGNKKNLFNFVNHPLHEKIKFNEKNQCFIYDNKKKFKGITRILKKKFYSNYKYKSDYSRNRENKIEDNFFGRQQGLLRGAFIHQQIKDYINRKTDKKFLEKYPQGVHLFTKKAILALKTWKLTPLFSELPICDPKNKIATSIDLLAYDNKFNIFLIEWKSGMDDYMYKGNSVMEGCLYNDNKKNSILNSPFNQAQLQVSVEMEILERVYHFNVHSSQIIQINNSGIFARQLDEKINDKRQEIYDYLIL